MLSVRRRSLVLCACVAFATGTLCTRAADAALPADTATITVADPQLDYDLRSVAMVAPDGPTHLMIGARPHGRPGETQSLLWITVDAAGQLLSRQDVPGALTATDSAALQVNDPSAGRNFALIDDRAVLVLHAADGDLRLLQMTGAGKQPRVQRLDLGAAGATVRRVLATQDDRLLLVGTVGPLSTLSEIDREGKVVGQRAVRERDMVAIDAVPLADGSVITVGEKGIAPEMFTWLGQVTSKGEVLNRRLMPGRPLDIACGKDGACILLIEAMAAGGSDVVMVGLSPQLQQQWKRSLVTAQPPMTSFRIAPIGSGGFILAGRKNRGVWIARVQADGSEVWAEAREPQASPELEMVSDVEISSNGALFAPTYTTFVVREREQFQVVRLMRFSAQ